MSQANPFIVKTFHPVFLFFQLLSILCYETLTISRNRVCNTVELIERLCYMLLSLKHYDFKSVVANSCCGDLKLFFDCALLSFVSGSLVSFCSTRQKVAAITIVMPNRFDLKLSFQSGPNPLESQYSSIIVLIMWSLLEERSLIF